SRAISIFGFTFAKGSLPKKRRLLIAQHTSNRYVAEISARAHVYEIANARANLGQYRQRNSNFLAQLFIPLQSANVHEQGARSISDIGQMNRLLALALACPTGKIPQQPRINRASEQLPVFCTLPGAIDIV